MANRTKLAYLSLQAVVDGQDSWAAVMEMVNGLEAEGWEVDRLFAEYAENRSPGVFRRLTEMLRVQARLAARIGEYDSVYVRAHPLSFPAAAYARLWRVPVVQECNGPLEDLFIAWPSARLARPVFTWLQIVQYRWADAIIAVSRGLADWLTRRTANPNVVTIGNGANTDAFSPMAPRRTGLPEHYTVFFGQFPAWQGIDVLLRAVRCTAWPDALTLVFVGDGEMRPAVQSAAAEMPHKVAYLGRLPYEEVGGVVAHALVAYVPIVTADGDLMHSPLKLYESMACGVPVVASNSLGIAEVIGMCGCGILVPPGNAEAIAAATRDLYLNPILAQEMGSRGRRAVEERYSWRARARQRQEVIERAIEARRR